MKKLFLSSVIAGSWISIGCIVNLSIIHKLATLGWLIGAFGFCIGLLGVVFFGEKLYTGTAGFIKFQKEDFRDLLLIFIGNIVGCFIFAMMMRIAHPELIKHSISIVNERLSCNLISGFIKAVACGMLMTFAVKFARERKNYIPLLFAVPAFIVSGYYHSIADGFYYCYAGLDVDELLIWFITFIGNFVGCNVFRITND